jgi:hypothetical protein
MGLMDWFKKMAGGSSAAAADDSAAPTAAEAQSAEIGGLNFMTAIDAHMKWKNRLESYINGTSQEELKVEAISRDDQCPLGKWIYSTGGESFGTIQSFGDMKAMHAHFHTCAGHVLTTAQQGKTDEALRMLNHGDYVRASERVKMQLARLYVQISERK